MQRMLQEDESEKVCASGRRSEALRVYHPNKENYQRNSENKFFGTVSGYQSPNNSRRAFFRYR